MQPSQKRFQQKIIDSILENSAFSVPIPSPLLSYVNKVRLAKMFGWTFADIDALSRAEYLAVLAVLNADNAIRNEQ